MNCPNCGFNNPPGLPFCGKCGTQLGRKCPACQYVNPMDFIYCGMCGVRIQPEPVLLPSAVQEIQFPANSSQPEKLLSSPLVGERRIVTVILADVRRSTDLLERIGTEAWVETMNRVFQILETEIYRFGGQIDQFRGDGLVAFFGANGAHEDDPERAVLTSLIMQHRMEEYAAELKKQLDVDLKLRIGVNTGEVIVTSIGDQNQHREDTAMGEAIAIAARMEAAAQPGTVLVSENTYRLVASNFQWEPLGEILVKGLTAPIAVYRPLQHLPFADSEFRSQEFRFTSTLTGRMTEFQLFSRCIEDLYGGSGGITIISGETGLGKSFLVSKVREHFKREEMLWIEAHENRLQDLKHPPENGKRPKIIWLSGTSRSFDQAWPYSMWLDMLQKWLDARPDEPRQDIRDRLYEQAQQLWGDDLADYYPHLATFLSLPLEEPYQERVRHLSAESLQRQFRHAIRSWIEKLSHRGPTVVVLNDIHWADTSGLDLLRYCLDLAENQAILWVLTMRPDRTSRAWELRQHIETEYPHRMIFMDLQPLSEPEICELLDLFVNKDALSEKTRQLIVTKSDGNPHYVQELVRALVSQGALQLDPEIGKYKEVEAVTYLDLPDSLQSLVLARIDRTSVEERRLLQSAAVIGHIFWWNVLEALVDNPGRLKNHLTSLQRSELISERSMFPILGMEYEFNSALIREVAYESLLNSQRIAAHRKVASYLERSSGLNGWAQYYGLIAYHYHHAGESRKELFYTLQAAEQARKIYANTEAYQDYTVALRLLDQMEQESTNEDQLYAIRTQRFEILKGRGEIGYIMGKIPESQADMRSLLPLARQMQDDPAWTIDALLVQAEVLHPDTHAMLNAGVNMAQEALRLSQQIADADRELKSLIALSQLQFLLRHDDRYTTTERALDLARSLGNRSAEVDLLLALGSASGLDNLEQQQKYLEAALAICYQLEDRKKETHLLHAIGEQFESKGDYFTQLKEYEEQRLQISQEIGDRLEEAHALMFCGQIRGIYLGDYTSGIEMVERSAQIWDKVTDRLYPNLRMAQMLIELERFEEAQEILESIRPTVEQSISDVSRAGYSLVWMLLHNALGGKDQYDYALNTASHIYQMSDENRVSRQYRMVAACITSSAYLGLVALAEDETERSAYLRLAIETSQQAVNIYQQFGFVRVAECVSEEILFYHSQALEANQRREEADEYLRHAYDEMMRKSNFIPEDSPFRISYLENIRLHREIRAHYDARFKRKARRKRKAIA
jgi:class 3 adenylate cyclase/predicted ATPase